MWVADRGDDKLFAYDLETMARLPASDFSLDAGNTSPIGIWSDGITMWVGDSAWQPQDLRLLALQRGPPSHSRLCPCSK